MTTDRTKKHTATELIDIIKSTRKTEDTVFIIGGGPSVQTLLPDKSVLFDHDVICCNNAYKLFPDAMITHFADKVWWQWHNSDKHQFLDKFHGYITTAASIQKPQWSTTPQVTVFDKTENNHKKGGLSLKPNNLCGGNAGHQAINIAFHLGYKQVVLIGFDLNKDRNNTHWHNDHERKTNTDNFINTILPGFESLDRLSRENDFRIYNLNHKSALTGFEFADLKDFIDT